MDLDLKDRHILEILQVDAKTSQAEIARRVGLSAASVNERIHKLEQKGVVRKYVALLDDRKVGNDITAFIESSSSIPGTKPRSCASRASSPRSRSATT
jgi:Lrp/AsnC family leucine-responsive transcriptional regulator